MTPRILLVDDDASMRRFVALALEELPIRLECVDSVAKALATLRGAPSPAVLITDLMMPGESGLDLLVALSGEPQLHAGTRLVVLSAGLDASTASQLGALGVWRQLRKPVSVAELENCVRDALALGEAAGATPGSTGAGSLSAAEQQAVERFFGGDAALFLAYRASCLGQFANDVAEGDRALAQADTPALARLAHSLKSVLVTLGRAAPRRRGPTARRRRHRP